MTVVPDADILYDIKLLIAQAKAHLEIGELRQTIEKLQQAELLQDSLIVYRLSRAPERKVFHVQVGGGV